MAAVGQVPHHAHISFSGLTSIKLSENRILMSRGSRGSDLQMASNNPMQREEEYETEEEYVSMAELDEENVNWTKLCCRIFSLVLFLGIIILAAVGSIEERLYYLSIIVAVALVCVFGISFLDLEVLKSRTVHVFRSATGSADISTSSNNNNRL